jgi:hypothetical protein
MNLTFYEGKIMSRTTFSGPVKSGTNKYAPYKNVGTTVLTQQTAFTFGATLVQNATFYIPAGSKITNIVVDVITAYDSATSATLTVGKTSAGTEYASGVNAKTAGRTTPTFTAAQLTNMQSTPIDVAADNSQQASSAIVVTITSVGQPTAGTGFVTVEYAQSDDRATYNTQ